MGRLVVVGVSAVVLIVAAVAALLVLRGSSSPAKGIVFQAKVHGLYELFRIDADGTHLRQITHLAVRNSQVPGVENPSWSPDGKRIVFDSDYEQTKQRVNTLFTIRPDGSDLKQVPLELGQFVGAPAYSPDGKEISFDWDLDTSPSHPQGISIAASDGSVDRQLTALQSPVLLDQNSNWSPDGKWIVFTERAGSGQSVLVKIRTDGFKRSELTQWPLNADHAKWSPDGSRIAFNSNKDLLPTSDGNLYTVDPRGGRPVQLTHFSGERVNAVLGGWSPDGSHLVFQLRGSTPNGVNQLFVVDAAGRHLRQLTHLPKGADPEHPSWSPAG